MNLITILAFNNTSQKYIKQTIVELACNNTLDHRNYDCEERESNFKNKMIENSYNFDLTIYQIVKELTSNNIFVKLINL